MEHFIKKGQPFAVLAESKESGGGRFWNGRHGHLYDSSPLYGPNPTWWYRALKRADSTLRITLGWHATYLPYYGPGSRYFKQGHPGIDVDSLDGKMYAPFDMYVYEEWIDPNGGSIVDTCVVKCRNANGKGGTFGVEHARIIEPLPQWNERSLTWSV